MCSIGWNAEWGVALDCLRKIIFGKNLCWLNGADEGVFSLAKIIGCLLNDIPSGDLKITFATRSSYYNSTKIGKIHL